MARLQLRSPSPMSSVRAMCRGFLCHPTSQQRPFARRHRGGRRSQRDAEPDRPNRRVHEGQREYCDHQRQHAEGNNDATWYSVNKPADDEGNQCRCDALWKKVGRCSCCRETRSPSTAIWWNARAVETNPVVAYPNVTTRNPLRRRWRGSSVATDPSTISARQHEGAQVATDGSPRPSRDPSEQRQHLRVSTLLANRFVE